jgi:hypothetical protein
MIDAWYKRTNQYAVPHTHADYVINAKVVLAMQQMGCSMTGAAILGGILLIPISPFKKTWIVMEEAIGKTQVILGNTILSENVEKVQELSEKDEKGRCLFCVSIDAGWNDCGSDKAYNSDSGHHITVDNCSSLMVTLHHMLKCYSKCEIGEKTGQLVKEHHPGPPREWRHMVHSKVAFTHINTTMYCMRSL